MTKHYKRAVLSTFFSLLSSSKHVPIPYYTTRNKSTSTTFNFNLGLRWALILSSSKIDVLKAKGTIPQIKCVSLRALRLTKESLKI